MHSRQNSDKIFSSNPFKIIKQYQNQHENLNSFNFINDEKPRNEVQERFSNFCQLIYQEIPNEIALNDFKSTMHLASEKLFMENSLYQRKGISLYTYLDIFSILYEDFIQGIRPQSQDSKLTYPLVPGRFLEFCKKAESREDTCVLIIDEINRANLAQVFGELMYLLEYRDREIPLAAGNTFRIPENVRIIGTMNTADRSIAQIDHALRRRFAFIELRPNYDVLRQYHLKTGFAVEDLIKILQELNQAIADKNYEIGISFFLTDNLRDDIQDIWQMEIEPYLEEYFFNQLDKVDEFRWDKVSKRLNMKNQ